MDPISSNRSQKINKIRTPTQLAALPDEALIGVIEAASLIARDRETLRRWRKNGVGPAFLRHPINVDRAEYSLGAIRKWISERIERPGE